jgi:hypothetical protein
VTSWRAFYLLIGVCLLLLDERGISTIVGIPSIKQVAFAGQRSQPRSLYQRPDGEWFLCKGRSATSPSRRRPWRRYRIGSSASAGIVIRIGDERKRTDGKARSAGERRLDAWTLIGPKAVADRCARLTGQTPS